MYTQRPGAWGPEYLFLYISWLPFYNKKKKQPTSSFYPAVNSLHILTLGVDYEKEIVGRKIKPWNSGILPVFYF